MIFVCVFVCLLGFSRFNNRVLIIVSAITISKSYYRIKLLFFNISVCIYASVYLYVACIVRLRLTEFYLHSVDMNSVSFHIPLSV